MPPKRKADDKAESQKKPKLSEQELAPNCQPTNKGIPDELALPPRIPGTMRIVTWNVCGLAASQKKGFKRYLEAEDPDILILTETKVNNEPVDPTLTERYQYRTAILSKYQPLSVDKTLPGHPDASVYKGRIICLEFEHYYIIGTYVVNAGENLKTLNVKKEWNVHFEAYIRELDEKKPVIWTGDLNVAPTEKDLSNSKKNYNKTAGHTEAEISSFMSIINPPVTDGNKAPKKFVDVWRKMHPDEQHYTYFSYRFNCRSKGIGWRLDYFVLSERLVEKAKLCEIRSEVYGASDHCPLVLEIEGGL